MKIAVITGASSGIGLATSLELAQKGFSIIGVGHQQARCDAAKAQIAASNQSIQVWFLCGDLMQQREIERIAEEIKGILARENEDRLDVLINNAGNAHGLEPLSEGNLEDWDAMMDGNVKGLLYVSKLIIPGMKERKSGHIVNISSVAARQTYANGVVYCASKRAVDVISEGMRLELTEFGIKVTNIQPGAVETDFSKVRFKGDEERAKTVYAGYEALKAEDIADAIYYCVNAPNRVAISDLTIYPSAQSEPRTIYRN